MANAFEIDREMFKGSFNDTPLALSRKDNEFKAFKNARLRKDMVIEKTDGRFLLNTVTGGSASKITGIVMPPARIPLLTVDATNNALYLHDGSGYVTATIASADYFTYAGLAAALQTAIQAVISGVTVTYGVSVSKKFRVANASGATIIVLWESSNSTISDTDAKKRIWGWNFSVSIANSGTSDSDFEVDSEPPCQGDKRYYFTDNDVEDEDGNEVFLKDGSTSITPSPHDIADAWFLDKSYLSNGVKNYIMRDRYLRETLPEKPVSVPVSSNQTATYDVYVQSSIPIAVTGGNQGNKEFTIAGFHIYHFRNNGTIEIQGSTGNDGTYTINGNSTYSSGTTTIVVDQAIPSATFDGNIEFTYTDNLRINSTNTQARMEIRVPGGWDTSKVNGLNDYIALKLRRHGTVSNYKMEVYFDIPSMGYSVLLKTIAADDLTQSYVVYTYDDFFFLIPSTTEKAYLRFKFIVLGATTTGHIDIGGEDASGNNWASLMDADGIFSTQASETFEPYCGLKITAITIANSAGFKTSLINKDGYETELSDAITPTYTGASLHAINITEPDGEFDHEFVRLYKTEEGGSTYYHVVDISKKFDYSLGHIKAIMMGMSDAALAARGQADVLTIRRSDVPYRRNSTFDGRNWITGSPEFPDHTIAYSLANTYEAYDLADNILVIGKEGSPIIGHEATEHFIAVFKENLIATVYLASPYAIRETTGGTGTFSHDSIVRHKKKDILFFQQQDGHFAYFDGYKVTPISEGLLDELVKTMNMARLDKTTGYFDKDKNEVKWSFCTGSNTTPNTSVRYNLNFNRWETDDTFADIWVEDRIAGTVNLVDRTGEELYLGAANLKTFYNEQAIYDYNPGTGVQDNIDMDVEFADSTYTISEYKSFFKFEIEAYAEDGTQVLNVAWFMDRSASSEGNHDFTLPAAAALQWTGMGGMGQWSRLKLTNDDKKGKVYISWMRVQFNEIGAAQL